MYIYSLFVHRYDDIYVVSFPVELMFLFKIEKSFVKWKIFRGRVNFIMNAVVCTSDFYHTDGNLPERFEYPRK